MPAVDFSIREGLSATASRGAADALAQVTALIEAEAQCPITLSHATFHRDRHAGKHNLG